MKLCWSILFGVVVVILCLGCSCRKIVPYSPSENYSTYEGMTNAVKSIAMSTENNVAGFQGIYSAPGKDTSLDSFVKTPSSIGCSGNMSSSTGMLCLSAEQTRMLQTRGGNA